MICNTHTSSVSIYLKKKPTIKQKTQNQTFRSSCIFEAYTHTHMCFTEIKIGHSFRWFNWSVWSSNSHKETVQVTWKKKYPATNIAYPDFCLPKYRDITSEIARDFKQTARKPFFPWSWSNTARNVVMFLVRNWKQIFLSPAVTTIK